MEYLIIGDIAGQYDALVRLAARVPKKTKILAVGDIVDRGPQSSEVVEWFIRNSERADSILGNHEHLFLDFYAHHRRPFAAVEGVYERGVWEHVGGDATLRSYNNKIPPGHISWLKSRQPYKLVAVGGHPLLMVTHAPLAHWLTLQDASKIPASMSDPGFHFTLLWNRGEPKKIHGTFQVMGHNSSWGLRRFGEWGISIDTFREGVLTGFRWPSREIIQEPFDAHEEPVSGSL